MTDDGIDKPLWDYTLSEVERAIASGRLSVLDYNDAIIARVEAMEPSIQAYVCLDLDGWRATAAELDAEAKVGKLRGPLHGIPIGVKDQFLVKGLPCRIADSWGRGGVSEYDATPVARMRAAGAIITGTTYMPDRWGEPPTCNPWNLEHTPGGSSSGSSAAVGGRMVPLALGESTGGSGIRPPAFCGVEALKPSYGRISGKGLYAISWSLDHPTIIGLTFEDIARTYNVIAGPDAADPTSMMTPFEPVTLTDLRPPRIGLVRNFFPEKAQEIQNEMMEQAAAKLGAAGATLVDLELGDGFDLVWPSWKITAAAERTAFHAWHEAKVTDVKPNIDALVPAGFYLHAQRVRRMVTEIAARAFEKVDFLLTPAATGSAPKGHGGGDNVMNSPWAATGMPAITFNIGLDPANGLPLGAQMTAAYMQEEALLRAGAWCEGVLGRLPAPALPVLS